MIDVLPGCEERVREAVSKMAGVQMVHSVTGDPDLIAYLDAEPYEEFAVILAHIRRVEGVRDTDSHLVLESR